MSFFLNSFSSLGTGTDTNAQKDWRLARHSTEDYNRGRAEVEEANLENLSLPFHLYQ